MTSPEQLGVPWRIVNATSLDLCVKVIPKSSSTKFGGCQPVDYPFRVALKIHLSAVPEDGKANAALIAFSKNVAYRKGSYYNPVGISLTNKNSSLPRTDLTKTRRAYRKSYKNFVERETAKCKSEPAKRANLLYSL